MDQVLISRMCVIVPNCFTARSVTIIFFFHIFIKEFRCMTISTSSIVDNHPVVRATVVLLLVVDVLLAMQPREWHHFFPNLTFFPFFPLQLLKTKYSSVHFNAVVLSPEIRE